MPNILPLFFSKNKDATFWVLPFEYYTHELFQYSKTGNKKNNDKKNYLL